MRIISLLSALLLMSGCVTSAPRLAGDEFWRTLRQDCGKAWAGRLVEGTEPGDAEIGAQKLIMHVRSCTDEEIRIPFAVGENRSRTWVLTRSAEGVRLKHDHRHEDGTPSEITQYGGDTRGAVIGRTLEFFADAETAAMLPAAATNVWTMSIDDDTFSYQLRRSNRRFRVDFDRTRPVEPPLPPW